jgi:ABC-type branched-subunit amino acid transport system ATPase component
VLLEVQNLTRRFGGLVAVSDVSFGIGEHEILGIFGPNGSGKTTLLNLISGVMPPSSGRIVWKSQDIQGWRSDHVAAVGLVKTFQNPKLFMELTVRENVAIASHLMLRHRLGRGRIAELLPWRSGRRHPDVEARLDRVLALCRLDMMGDQLAAGLSYGQEKMLGVAMAMMCEPELLLLDEPASGLGDAEIVNLEAVLADLRATRTTLCIIDHKVDFLRRTADRAIALQQGVKIAEGTPDEVLHNPRVVEAYLGRSHAGAIG